VKALVWHGDQRLALEELPDPTPGGSDVVLEVELAGICGSDLHGYRGHPGPRVPPLVLGHEVVGQVDGQSYTVYPLVACGRCAHCLAGEDNLCASWQLLGLQRPGVFAEQVLVPRGSLVALPAGIDPLRAVLAEPLACCVGALAPHLLAEGSTLAVLCCGPIGLLAIHLAHRSGARVSAVDPLAGRRETARRLGADHAVATPAELEPAAAALALDAAGFESTWRGAIDAVANGGNVVMLGLGSAEGSFPMAALVRRAITLRGHFAYSRADFALAVEILAEGDLDLGWLSAAALADGPRAFANLVERPSEYTKIILSPR
jgi:threonine dehydrogenase-like Zn-dependent dehydrogenase